MALAREGRFEEAEQWLLTLLAKEPSAELWNLLGRVRAQRGDLDGADDAFGSALAQDPGHRESAAARAALDRHRGFAGLFRVRAWQGVSAALAILLVIGGLGAARPRSDAQSEGRIEEALASLQSQIAELRRDALPSMPVGSVALLGEIGSYARFLAAAQQMRTPEVILSPRIEGGSLLVVASGSVPTPFVRDALTRAASAEGLRLDASSLEMSNRVCIRDRDTLSRIAFDVYGDASRWTEIAAANREVSSPRALRLGQWITIP